MAADPRLQHHSIAVAHRPEGRMSLPDQMIDRWQARRLCRRITAAYIRREWLRRKRWIIRFPTFQ